MIHIIVNGQPRLMGACIPDSVKPGDSIIKSPAPNLSASSLRSLWKLAIRNQGARGTCTANGVLEAAGFLFTRDGKPDPVLSRLFLYYVTRIMEGTSPSIDSGCQIRDVFTALQQTGVCLESLWPYSDDNTTFTLKPSDEAFDAAGGHKALFFYRCPDLSTIKASIAQGFPVVFGANIPADFMSDEVAATGIMKMPTPGVQFVGGHCMIFVGWDDKTQYLTAVNSWGDGWGDSGFCTLPYGMIDNGYVTDCWSLRKEQE